MKKSYHSQGFTLLELIVSVAAIALVSVVLSQVFFSTLRTNTKTEILKEVKQNGELVIGNMTRMVQNAQTIQNIATVCSDTGVAAQTLTLTNPDQGTTTVGCREDIVSGATITRIASTSASATIYLTGSNVTLGGTTCAQSSLQFVCKGGTGIPSTVSITFSLAQSGTPYDQFEKSSALFQTSVTMRNTPQ